ncbi:MAG: aspartyl-phosphate phosphatase Spo0E family protein [Clostridiales bacterium]|nr:aspartyl-phosphate phosphatase Spo0E family protein [Clostridiales bacterium]
MESQELIKQLEKKRKLLDKIISNNDMKLNNEEVLACSQELDKLIANYLRSISAKMFVKKRFYPI